MRALSPIGSSLLIIAAYVFTSGGSLSGRYMIPGGCIALAGVVVLAVAAVVAPVSVSEDEADETNSVRSRRGEGSETEPAEEMDQATASS